MDDSSQSPQHQQHNSFAHRKGILSYASKLAIGLFAVEGLMQVGIAVGLFPINIVWGGSQQELTIALRFASIFAALILLGFAYVIHLRATKPTVAVRRASWFITAYMILNTFGNYVSSNVFERYVSGFITLILSVCCGIVSSSSTTTHPEGYETFV